MIYSIYYHIYPLILYETYRFYINVTTENMTDLAQFDYRFHMEITGFCCQDYRFAVGQVGSSVYICVLCVYSFLCPLSFQYCEICSSFFNSYGEVYPDASKIQAKHRGQLQLSAELCNLLQTDAVKCGLKQPNALSFTVYSSSLQQVAEFLRTLFQVIFSVHPCESRQ